MRYLFHVLTILVICASSCHAWENPWDTGTGRFVDPFAQEKREPKASPSSTKSYSRQATPSQQKTPSLPTLTERPSGPPILQDRKTDEIETLEKDLPVYITPFGLETGDDMAATRARLLGYGFVSGGACGQGEVFFLDPATMCIAIHVSGTKTIEGASTFVSKTCVRERPEFAFAAAFAKEGREFAEGWEISRGNGKGTSCLRKPPVLGGSAAPKFLGIITGGMKKDVVAAVLEGLGAKLKKTYDNGAMFALDGSVILHEWCRVTGDMVSIAIDVRKETPHVRSLIDRMAVSRDRMDFENLIITSERGKTGKPDKIEFVYTTNERRCNRMT